MSTKIYNGYYSSLSLARLLSKFIDMKAEFKNQKKQSYISHLVKETVFQIDELHSKGEDVIHFDFLKERHKIFEQEVSETISKGRRNPSLDFMASCCVFPLATQKTLIMFYSDHRDILNVWESKDFINDYHFQNQTDKPKNISKTDWEKRREEWDKVLTTGIPADSGYTFTFNDEILPHFYGVDLSQYIPNARIRANNLFCDQYVDKKITELRQENANASFPLYFIRAKEAWHKYKFTDEYEIQMESIVNQLIQIDFSEKSTS